MVYMLTFGVYSCIFMVNVTIYSIHGSYGIGERCVYDGSDSPKFFAIFVELSLSLHDVGGQVAKTFCWQFPQGMFKTGTPNLIFTLW